MSLGTEVDTCNRAQNGREEVDEIQFQQTVKTAEAAEEAAGKNF